MVLAIVMAELNALLARAPVRCSNPASSMLTLCFPGLSTLTAPGLRSPPCMACLPDHTWVKRDQNLTSRGTAASKRRV